MAARTREAADDAFIEAQRLVLSCISDCAVFGSRASSGAEQSLTIWDPGQRQANLLRLSTHDGVGELDLRVTVSYVVDVVGVQAFLTRTVGYRYLVSDVAGQDLVAYDWHPTGTSPITTPHLHMPAARAVVLAQRAGSPRAGARRHLGTLHFPTGSIGTATVVDMLIREFGVDPIRPNWERLLHDASTS